MAESVGIRIEGLTELQTLLKDELPRAAHNIARQAVQAIAQEFAKELRPVTPQRTGNLRRSISVQRGRGDRNAIFSDVYFASGADAKADGFYWRFIEHGTAPHAINPNSDLSRGSRQTGQLLHTPAQPFVGPLRERFAPRIPDMFREKMGVQLEKTLARRRKALTKKLGF